MKEAILAVLLGLPRAPGADTSHLATVAAAIDSASLRAVCGQDWPKLGCNPVWKGSRRRLASALVIKGHLESGYHPRIQRNECRIRFGECDGGQSRSYWQFKRTWGLPIRLWNDVVGDEFMPTVRAAFISASALGRAKSKCKTDEGTLAAYASGHCEWSGAKKRLAFWNLTDARLVVALRRGVDESIESPVASR